MKSFQVPTVGLISQRGLRARRWLLAIALLGALALPMTGSAQEKPKLGIPGPEVKEPRPGRPAAKPAAAAKSGAAKPIDGNQWTSWRGPENTGVSREKGLVSSWKTEKENLIWKADVGGRSTPIVMNGRVFILHLGGQKEMMREEVVCLEAETGKILWKNSFDIFHTDVPADRVGWASLVGDPETGYIYAHGVQGMMVCYNQDGKIVWQSSLTEQYGQISGYGGRTESPMLDGDLMIMSSLTSGLGDHARGMHRYWAVNKRTGEFVWWSSIAQNPEDTTFSVPTVAIINGERMLISGNGDGWVYGMKVATGEKIWSFHLCKRGLNSSVLVSGNKVYASHSEENIDNTEMGRIVCIDATGTGDVTKTKELWRFDGFKCGYVSPVLAEGKLYDIDNSANLVCLDAETGKKQWEMPVGKVGWGSAVWGDGKLYVPEVNGAFYIIDVSGKEPKTLSTIQFGHPPEHLDDIRGCPAIANGKLYLLTRDALYCVGDKNYKPQPITIPPLADVGPADKKATTLQAIPADAQIGKKGDVKLSGRLFDGKGRLIGPASNVTFELAGLKGKLAPTGEFTPDPTINGQFGIIKATVKTDDGVLTAGARVRVNADLPITEDFEKIPEGGGPSYWVGASKLKFQTVVENGNHIFKKDSTDQRFQRALVYIGPPELTGYTVQADVKAAAKKRILPDMGIINNRYVLELRGNGDDLRIVSWVSMPRIEKVVPFTVEKDVWYTMKCRVDIQGDKGIVKGKVWKKGEAEPKDWTIELEDPNPHKAGSPGLACFAQADLYYDNIKIEKNN